jgi:choline kinase
MKAIILAAGKGVRLNGSAGAAPKCLVKVGGLTLIERQIQSLKASGIDDIVVVVGFERDRVRQACAQGVRFVENEQFAQTNSLYSLWLTRDFLSDGFVVMNSDVLFHPQILTDLLTSKYEDALLVAYREEGEPEFGDEEMKVRVRHGQVVDISKTMNPSDADGENVGIVKFGPSGSKLLIEQMGALVGGGFLSYWAPRAFLEFALRRPLHAIGTRGYPWIEIDFPDDYRRAAQEILPKINNFK